MHFVANVKGKIWLDPEARHRVAANAHGPGREHRSLIDGIRLQAFAQKISFPGTLQMTIQITWNASSVFLVRAHPLERTCPSSVMEHSVERASLNDTLNPVAVDPASKC